MGKFITPEGMIFHDYKNFTGEELYRQFLIDKEKREQIDICEPTDRERMEQLEGMVGMLAEQVARQSLGMSLI